MRSRSSPTKPPLRSKLSQLILIHSKSLRTKPMLQQIYWHFFRFPSLILMSSWAYLTFSSFPSDWSFQWGFRKHQDIPSIICAVICNRLKNGLHYWLLFARGHHRELSFLDIVCTFIVGAFPYDPKISLTCWESQIRRHTEASGGQNWRRAAPS